MRVELVNVNKGDEAEIINKLYQLRHKHNVQPQLHMPRERILRNAKRQIILPAETNKKPKIILIPEGQPHLREAQSKFAVDLALELPGTAINYTIIGTEFTMLQRKKQKDLVLSAGGKRMDPIAITENATDIVYEQMLETIFSSPTVSIAAAPTLS